MSAKFFAILVALSIFLFIVDLIRRQRMTFNFSILWLVASAVVLFFAFNDRFLARISRMAGFELTSNFVFFLFIAFTVLISLFLTLYMNVQNNKSEQLAQTVGILENKIRLLEKQRGTSEE